MHVLIRLAAVIAAFAAVLVAPVARRGTVGSVMLPAASPGPGFAAVGPLFPGGDIHGQHSCTASVVAAPPGDLVLTAAHCVTGDGHAMVFAPGFADERTPYGVWWVTGVYADPGWLTDQDPRDDYAIVRVAPVVGSRLGPRVQRVTGGDAVALTPARGTPVTVIGYPAGVGGAAVRCHTTLYWPDGMPAFTCDGFVDGTSGSPWLVVAPGGTEVVGLIGGEHQGGCLPFISRSPDFRPDVIALVARAARGGPTDTLPTPGDSGC